MKISIIPMASALLLASASAFGQGAKAAPAFEVASVKPAPHVSLDVVFSGKAHVGVRIDKAYADFGATPLQELVTYAYRVKPYQVLGPDWMKDARFDVLGKLPAGASKDSVPEMVQGASGGAFPSEGPRGEQGPSGLCVGHRQGRLDASSQAGGL
jgi:hypothetical protein